MTSDESVTSAASVAPERVAEATAERLRGLADRPLAEHVDAYDGVHRLLQDTLATLDEV